MSLRNRPEGAADQVRLICDPEDVVSHGDGKPEIGRSKALNRALKAGEPAPNFHISGARRSAVTLFRLLEAGPVVLSFHWGSWCPYCTSELRALATVNPEIERLGAQVVALSPEKLERLTAYDNLPFILGCDRACRVARAFGIDISFDEKARQDFRNRGHILPEMNAAPDWRLPLPAAYVIDRAGMIVFSHVGLDQKNRFNPPELLPILASMQRREMGYALSPGHGLASGRLLSE
jgi:peroxiredoxin